MPACSTKTYLSPLGDSRWLSFLLPVPQLPYLDLTSPVRTEGSGLSQEMVITVMYRDVSSGSVTEKLGVSPSADQRWVLWFSVLRMFVVLRGGGRVEITGIHGARHLSTLPSGFSSTMRVRSPLRCVCVVG